MEQDEWILVQDVCRRYFGMDDGFKVLRLTKPMECFMTHGETLALERLWLPGVRHPVSACYSRKANLLVLYVNEANGYEES